MELKYLLHFRYEPEFVAPILYVWISTETRLVILTKSAIRSDRKLIELRKSALCTLSRLGNFVKSAKEYKQAGEP